MKKGCTRTMPFERYGLPAVIQGKWHGHMYDVQRELGRGANGVVFLVQRDGREYALKVGEDTLSITAEVSVLKQLSRAQGGILGPSVYDVDDWSTSEGKKPFYVMNVINGLPLPVFVRTRGREWIPVFIWQICSFLEHLHAKGWVFGDLKPDNLSVSGTPPKIAWFDAGGMTRIGRSVKEYTEVYDRGFWQMGSRKADPAYDLFSLAIITIQLFTDEEPQPGEEPRQTLQQKIFETAAFHPYRQVLWRALNGEYARADQMRKEWVQAWKREHEEKSVPGHASVRSRSDGQNRSKARCSAKKGGSGTAPGSFGQSKRQTKLASVSGKQPAKNGAVIGKGLTIFFFSSFLLFLFTLLLFAHTF